jgi:hypothetical protein
MGLHLAQLKFAWAQKQTIVQHKKLAPAVQPKNITLVLYARLAPGSRLQMTLLVSPTPHWRKGGCGGGRCPMPRTRRTRRQHVAPHLFLSPRQRRGAAATRHADRLWAVVACPPNRRRTGEGGATAIPHISSPPSSGAAAASGGWWQPVHGALKSAVRRPTSLPLPQPKARRLEGRAATLTCNLASYLVLLPCGV